MDLRTYESELKHYDLEDRETVDTLVDKYTKAYMEQHPEVKEYRIARDRVFEGLPALKKAYGKS